MRKLATIRTIDELTPIPDADRIETATVGGWKVVVQKGLYKPGDKAVFFEVDSIVPRRPWSEFLYKDERSLRKQMFEGKEYEGFRLKTVKLKKQLSQGLLVPLDAIVADGLSVELSNVPDLEGLDLTDALGVVKWDPPLNANLVGICRSTFPSFIPKTDEERIQNLKRELELHKDTEVYVTEKLDGTSCTMYKKDGEFHVCSRNMDLKDTPESTYWKMARKYGLDRILPEGGVVQGEIIGPGIQGNPLGLSEVEFRVFSSFHLQSDTYADKGELDIVISSHAIRLEDDKMTDCQNLKMVPVIEYCKLGDRTLEGWLEFADGKSALNPEKDREGIVIRGVDDKYHELSMKAISNTYLLNEK